MADSESGTTQSMPPCSASLWTQSSKVMASPSWEVPIPKATLVWYSPGALLYASAMIMPAAVVPVSVATIAPLMVGSGGSSCNHMPGSVRGRIYWGAAVVARWGQSVVELWCDVMWCGVVWCGVVWCGVVWCGVVWCGVVWCGVVWCGVVWCGVVWRGVVWRGVVWCGVVWCGEVRCGVVWCGVVWCGVVWCGVVWAAEGAVTKWQWPGWSCTGGNAKQEGCVSERVLCVFVRVAWRSASPGSRFAHLFGRLVS